MKLRTRKKKRNRAFAEACRILRRNHGSHDRWVLLAEYAANPWASAVDAANVWRVMVQAVTRSQRRAQRTAKATNR